MFHSIVGHEMAKAYLQKALEGNCLPHALLFEGPEGVGKSLMAKALASHLLHTDSHRIEAETHPDFHPIRPEGKSGLHAIEAFRTLIDEVHQAPFEAPGKVFLLYEAERMQPAAANALLKTLEEPNPDTTLILLTSAPREILPTILSRCTRLSFQPLSEEAIASLLLAKGYSIEWVKFAHGSLGRALELATRPRFEELLFPLLSRPPPYPELALGIEKIEVLMEDEDPVQKNRRVEALFSAILLWFRDQHARRMGLAEGSLFFPKEPPVTSPLPSLEAVQKAVAEARLAFQRNMKFSVCLERCLALKSNF